MKPDGARDLERVRQYWSEHPAGIEAVRHLTSDSEAFWDLRDRETGKLYPYLDEMYGFADAAGRDTLELGCGMGYNAQRLAQCGARLVAADLTAVAVALTRTRFRVRRLAAKFLLADAERLGLRSASFDRVFSSGVIHHTPNMDRAIGEIHRVLRPGGSAVVMFYHRHSLNYHYRIMFRLGLKMLLLRHGPGWLVDRWVARRPDLAAFRLAAPQRLTLADILRAGTDVGGLANPLSRALSRQEARRLFQRFSAVRFATEDTRSADGGYEGPWRWVPWLRRRLDRRYGWYLYVYARK